MKLHNPTHNPLRNPLHNPLRNPLRKPLRKSAACALAMTAAAASAFLGTATAHADPIPLSTACGNITYGQDDACVYSLQLNLNAFGFGLSVDGNFGDHTLAAVKWLQTKAHLQNSAIAVDGQAGPMTITYILGFTDGLGGWSGKTVAAGPSNCTLWLWPHPNAQTASGSVDDNSGTCAGVLERSPDGGRSWSDVSSNHVITSGSVTTYDYSDNSTQLVRMCGYAWDGNSTVQACTLAF